MNVENFEKYADIEYAMYENLVFAKRSVTNDLQRYLTERRNFESDWILILRYVCRHVRNTIETGEGIKTTKHNGWIQIISNNGNSSFIVSENYTDKIINERKKKQLAKNVWNNRKHFQKFLAVSLSSNNKDYPVAVILREHNLNSSYLLTYVYDPISTSRSKEIRPAYLGTIIWTAAQQVLFNDCININLRKYEDELEESFKNADYKKYLKALAQLWPLYYIVNKDYENFNNIDVSSLGENKTSYARKLRSNAIDYTLKAALGNIKIRFTKDDLEIITLGKYAKIFTNEDQIILKMISIVTGLKDVDLYYKENNLLSEMISVSIQLRKIRNSTNDKNAKFDFCSIARELRSVCERAEKEIGGYIYQNNKHKNEIIVDEKWGRGFLTLQVLSILSKRKLTEVGLDFTPLGMDILRDILIVLIVTFRNFKYPYFFERTIWYDPVSYTEALINTLTWYTHQGLGLEVDFPIGDSLRRIYESEAALYSLKPFYRDHLYHVIDVCMLGHYLIQRNFRGICNIDEKLSNNVNIKHWYVASIFHDIGYVIELLSSAIKLTKKLESPDMLDFCDGIEQALKESEIKCLKKIISDGYLEDNNNVKVEHGIASAIYLIHVLDTVPDGKKKYDSAVKAIIAHNLVPGHLINQKNDPIGALLVLCDELQEWGRPVIETSKFVRYIVATRNFGDYELERTQPLRYLKIKEKDRKNLQFTLQYFPHDEGQYDPARIWFGKIANLERVEYQNPHANWEVIIKTPLSQKYRRLGLYEMDLMRKCCWYNEELLPLRRWIEMAIKNTWYSKLEYEEIIKFKLDLSKNKYRSITRKSLNSLNIYQINRLQEIYTAVENEWLIP